MYICSAKVLFIYTVQLKSAFAILINHTIRANPEWSGDAK